MNLGQYLKEGDMVVTLQAFDPIYVNFSLPQQDLSKLVLGEPVQLQRRRLSRSDFQRHDHGD